MGRCRYRSVIVTRLGRSAVFGRFVDNVACEALSFVME